MWEPVLMPAQAWFYVVMGVIAVSLLFWLHVAETRAKAKVPPLTPRQRPRGTDVYNDVLFQDGNWGT